MPAKKQKTFRVGGFIKAWVEVDVSAESLEAALELARTMTPSDFVTMPKDGAVDVSLKIVGVSADYPSVD